MQLKKVKNQMKILNVLIFGRSTNIFLISPIILLLSLIALPLLHMMFNLVKFIRSAKKVNLKAIVRKVFLLKNKEIPKYKTVHTLYCYTVLLLILYIAYQLFQLLTPFTQRKPWEDFSLISVIGQMFICGIFLSIYLVICFKIISVAKAMIKRTLIRIKPKLANTLTKTQDGKI